MLTTHAALRSVFCDQAFPAIATSATPSDAAIKAGKTPAVRRGGPNPRCQNLHVRVRVWTLSNRLLTLTSGCVQESCLGEATSPSKARVAASPYEPVRSWTLSIRKTCARCGALPVVCFVRAASRFVLFCCPFCVAWACAVIVTGSNRRLLACVGAVRSRQQASAHAQGWVCAGRRSCFPQRTASDVHALPVRYWSRKQTVARTLCDSLLVAIGSRCDACVAIVGCCAPA